MYKQNKKKRVSFFANLIVQGDILDKKTIIELAIGAVLFAACLVGFIYTKGHIVSEPTKKRQKTKKLFFIGMLISAWFTVGAFIAWFSGKGSHLGVEFEMFSPRTDIFGFSVAQTTITATAATLVLLLLLLLFRLIAVPKFSVDKPVGIQNAAEIIVEFMDGFVEKSTGSSFVRFLSPYMISVALFMVGCAFSEMLGLRAPTSDLTCTLSLGLCTFALINICGIRKNGIGGRLKNMGGAVPAMRPIMIPLKAVSDIAVPVSLACRLFGNMLGGLMVMDLLKGVLGGYASGLPAIAGLYFNLFHPGIQIYIFITLSLTFINEAME